MATVDMYLCTSTETALHKMLHKIEKLCNKLGSSSVLDVEGEFDEVLILQDIPKANP